VAELSTPADAALTNSIHLDGKRSAEAFLERKHSAQTKYYECQGVAVEPRLLKLPHATIDIADFRGPEARQAWFKAVVAYCNSN
jgi:hypothetical protein